MSDTPQGQDWWQASDGKWYPPKSYQPPTPPPGGFYVGPQAGYPPPGWVAPATSGLAIASLILSILWIGGLGSLLAVIFGIVALSQINRSQGRKSGSGLAIAGLVIGGVGVLGAVAIIAIVIPTANSVTSAADDSVAQANLQTSLTAAQIYYTENGRSYAGVDSPGPISNIGDMGTGFTYSQGTSSTGTSDISLVNAGDGTWLILAAYAPDSNDCWFLVDLTAPSTQTLAGVPSGSLPGTYYGVATGASAITCLAAPDLQPTMEPGQAGFPSG